MGQLIPIAHLGGAVGGNCPLEIVSLLINITLNNIWIMEIRQALVCSQMCASCLTDHQWLSTLHLIAFVQQQTECDSAVLRYIACDYPDTVERNIVDEWLKKIMTTQYIYNTFR